MREHPPTRSQRSPDDRARANFRNAAVPPGRDFRNTAAKLRPEDPDRVTQRRVTMKYDSEEYRKFEQERIDAGKLIDLNTAILHWGWGEIIDVYGVLDPVEETNIGRVYFLRAPDSDIWVNI